MVRMLGMQMTSIGRSDLQRGLCCMGIEKICACGGESADFKR